MTEFDSVILPGGEGKVTASINTEHLKGVVAKSITVSVIDDPTIAPITLTLRANVRVPIEILPTERVVLQGRLGDVQPVDVTLSAVDGTLFDIVSFTKSTEDITVKVKPADGPANAKPKDGMVASGTSKYTVTVAPTATAGVGNSFVSLAFKTSHPKAENLTVTVSLSLTGDVDIQPARLMFFPPATAGGVPASAGAPVPMTQVLKVTKANGPELKILGVESTDPDFKTKLTTLKAGREFEVEVKYTGAAGRGFIRSEVKIKTNDPKQGDISVPISGRS